jgi:translation elongation factor EF-Tu-like GTPase
MSNPETNVTGSIISADIYDTLSLLFKLSAMLKEMIFVTQEITRMSFLKRLFGRKDEELPDASDYLASRPSGPFRMSVDDIFVISNRGIVLTGQVEVGTLQKGDAIEIRNDNVQVYTQVVSIESFRKPLKVAKEGDLIGILLPADVPRAVLVEGMTVIKQDKA